MKKTITNDKTIENSENNNSVTQVHSYPDSGRMASEILQYEKQNAILTAYIRLCDQIPVFLEDQRYNNAEKLEIIKYAFNHLLKKLITQFPEDANEQFAQMREDANEQLDQISSILSALEGDHPSTGFSVINFSDTNKVKQIYCNLPADVLRYVAKHTDNKTLCFFSNTSKTTYALLAEQRKHRYHATRLLQFVMDGDVVSAEQLLSSYQKDHPDISLVTELTTGVEQNGRKWEKPVSVLEFAAWAGDVSDPHNEEQQNIGMVDVLLKYLPAGYTSVALQQLQHVQMQGTEHGEMMKPYEDLENIYLKYEKELAVDRESYCLKQIGGAQRLLPLCGLQIFCDPNKMNNQFRHAPLRTFRIDEKYGPLLPLIFSGLSEQFYFYKFTNLYSKYSIDNSKLCGTRPCDMNMGLPSMTMYQLRCIKLDCLNSHIEALRQKLNDVNQTNQQRIFKYHT